MSTLDIVGLTKRHGASETLKGIDLSLADGEFLVLLGASGCGKSTLLAIIAGLAEPSGGDVRIDGRSVLGVHPKDRDIAMVFQSYALYPNLSVARNIGFGLEMRKVPKPAREAAVARAAGMLQIGHLLSRKPGELSGGQRQRVAIGRAVVREPKVFLFDEPLSNLDAQLRLETRTEMKRLHQALKATIVYVTHDQIEAMTLATRIAVMREGRIEQVGTPREVYERPANLYVAGFIGSPPMNRLAGAVTADGAAWSPAGDAGRIALPAWLAARARPGRPLVLGIRPERLAIADERRPGCLAMRVEVVELTGPEALVVGSIGSQAVTAVAGPDTALEPGMTVELHVPEEAIRWFDAETGDAL